MKNEIQVNGEKKTEDELKDQLYQQPNTNILGYRLRLNLYNMAKQNADSSYRAWLERKPGRHEHLRRLLSEKQVQRLGKSFLVSGLSSFLKRVGEPPVVVDPYRVRKSANRLSAYYYKKGFFRNKVGYSIDTLEGKKAQVTYNIITGRPYIIDTLTAFIETPALDSLYNLSKTESMVKPGKQYNETDFAGERERLTTYFRNRGAYRFQQNFIRYIIDTVTSPYKANVDLVIDNETIRRGDSTTVRPFKLYKISSVNIHIKNPSAEGQPIDTVRYKGFNLISPGRLNYRPKAITDAVFLSPGSPFADFRRTLTLRYVNNLKVFFYPSIQFVEDTTDVSGSSLITNIYLNPRKKYRFNVTADFTHSNIQDFGIQGSLGLSIRNIFRGAEILDLSTRGNIGSSRDLAIQDKSFFNVSEYGADAKLSFPRIFFPFKTDRIISKEMIPSSLLSLGVSRQRNIGLDKENFTGILSYNWSPRRNSRVTARYDLFNIQYIRNVNAGAFFRVYESSYNRLNDIARANQAQVNPAYFDQDNNLTIGDGGTDGFIADVQSGNITLNEEDKKNVNSIEERRQRLTENNLIFSSNFTYTTSTRQNLTDNTFFIFKTKLETAGNTLGLLSSLTNNNNRSASGNLTFLDVEYSQYAKVELDLIKHFDLRRGTVLAMRAFGGIAIPYGNSNSIPFARSYFAGGSNDNRAWQSYRLGPGRTGGRNDFNEANLKLAYSAELRFNLFGKMNGAIFGDLGNIWNVLDEVDDPNFTFNGFSSFKDLALGTGFGLRYDFSFFVVRFDVGFKTYNPGRPENDRWLKEYNFSNAVLNVGINYPF
ncbi:hypothetical protein CHU92_05425 [Flavobacterium cyanobacteriorum]|uniref:Bacterial surface antigen (D15) domain-containing protein n=1 Tax=Flavobacterium cyanobacteriorum TaxID=2022802 RepID=A0A255ZA97_9FLAO|nr:BamA/TamA family outer membrane protein [Flavobacterium cyanobacteriorum]OYQ38362.1 hypothetical protein CHU92_05425 [Flavobacterium cyanobacteriorum]